MLDTIGVADIEDLFSSIPKGLRTTKALNLGPELSEPALLEHLKDLSLANRNAENTPSFLGGGAYRHYVPAAVSELAGRAEFVTPYTP